RSSRKNPISPALTPANCLSLQYATKPAAPRALRNREPASKKGKQNEEASMNAFQGFPRITPFLWFDSNAEEAVNFYLTVFKNSQRLDELRTTEEGPGPKGSILT